MPHVPWHRDSGLLGIDTPIPADSYKSGFGMPTTSVRDTVAGAVEGYKGPTDYDLPPETLGILLDILGFGVGTAYNWNNMGPVERSLSVLFDAIDIGTLGGGKLATVPLKAALKLGSRIPNPRSVTPETEFLRIGQPNFADIDFAGMGRGEVPWLDPDYTRGFRSEYPDINQRFPLGGVPEGEDILDILRYGSSWQHNPQGRTINWDDWFENMEAGFQPRNLTLQPSHAGLNIKDPTDLSLDMPFRTAGEVPNQWGIYTEPGMSAYIAKMIQSGDKEGLAAIQAKLDELKDYYDEMISIVDKDGTVVHTMSRKDFLIQQDMYNPPIKRIGPPPPLYGEDPVTGLPEMMFDADGEMLFDTSVPGGYMDDDIWDIHELVDEYQSINPVDALPYELPVFLKNYQPNYPFPWDFSDPDMLKNLVGENFQHMIQKSPSMGWLPRSPEQFVGDLRLIDESGTDIQGVLDPKAAWNIPSEVPEHTDFFKAWYKTIGNEFIDYALRMGEISDTHADTLRKNPEALQYLLRGANYPLFQEHTMLGSTIPGHPEYIKSLQGGPIQQPRLQKPFYGKGEPLPVLGSDEELLIRAGENPFSMLSVANPANIFQLNPEMSRLIFSDTDVYGRKILPWHQTYNQNLMGDYSGNIADQLPLGIGLTHTAPITRAIKMSDQPDWMTAFEEQEATQAAAENQALINEYNAMIKRDALNQFTGGFADFRGINAS